MTFNRIYIGNSRVRSGGAFATKLSIATVTNSTFFGNRAVIAGGAVLCDDSQIEITDTNFVNNYATGYLVADSQGGALYIIGVGNPFHCQAGIK